MVHILILRRLAWKAAVTAATDPRVQAKAAQLYKTQVKPRAANAYVNTVKPAVAAGRNKVKPVVAAGRAFLRRHKNTP